MDPIEQAVRDSADQLQTAVNAAVAAGYHILWPSQGAPITAIALSATGKIADFVDSGDLAENEVRAFTAPAVSKPQPVAALPKSEPETQ